MTYGVVLCPNCKRPKGVNLEAKTTTCICGKRLRIPEMRVLYRTEDARNLPEAIGRITAKLEGREEEFEEMLWKKPTTAEEVDPYSEIASLAVQVTGEKERAMVVLQGLGERRGSFTVEEAREVFDRIGLGDPGPWIEQLLRESVLYEPKKGTFRKA